MKNQDVLRNQRAVEIQNFVQMSLPLRRYPLLQTLLEGETTARNIADRLYDDILIRIVRGEFVGGDELKSTELAAEYDVSRTPVIHSLTRLASDGIVFQQANQRAVVRPGAENWLLDIHHLRIEIEPGAAQAATGKIPVDIKANLMSLARDARSLDGSELRETLRIFDYALHLVVAEYCGNLAIRETIRRCWLYKRLSYDEFVDSKEELMQGYEEHVDILNHLHLGNGPGAASAMRNHLKAAAKHRFQRII